MHEATRNVFTTLGSAYATISASVLTLMTRNAWLVPSRLLSPSWVDCWTRRESWSSFASCNFRIRDDWGRVSRNAVVVRKRKLQSSKSKLRFRTVFKKKEHFFLRLFVCLFSCWSVSVFRSSVMTIIASFKFSQSSYDWKVYDSVFSRVKD